MRDLAYAATPGTICQADHHDYSPSQSRTGKCSSLKFPSVLEGPFRIGTRILTCRRYFVGAQHARSPYPALHALYTVAPHTLWTLQTIISELRRIKHITHQPISVPILARKPSSAEPRLNRLPAELVDDLLFVLASRKLCASARSPYASGERSPVTLGFHA